MSENLSPPAAPRLHIQGLNGLRAIAAFAVIVSHINRSLDWFDLPARGRLDMAPYGVVIFFSLSGFLITYLLLKEQQKTNTISISQFYMRRILRIWPLYYFYLALTIIVAYLFNDQQMEPVSIGLYIFLMPNVAYLMNKVIALNHHYWSLGVEEQFYSFWPWGIKKSANALWFLVIFLSTFLLLKIGAHLLHYDKVYDVFSNTSFDCMAIGGIGGYFFCYQDQRMMKYLRMKIVQLIAWGAIAACLFNRFHIISMLDKDIMALVAVVLIFNISDPKQSLVNLENRFFDFLGRISFGLYVYHMLVIFLLSKLLHDITMPEVAKTSLVYVSCVLGTIGIAYLSFTFLERWFIARKEKFSTILSKSSGYSVD